MITDDLITQAYYLADVVSRDFETVSGSQLADGLTYLNGILGEQSATSRYIPYYTHQSLNTIPGQEEYDVVDLVDVDAATFNIGPVRYSMRRQDRRYYFGSPRVDNIESLPFTYFFERQTNGGKLYLYFLPADVYVVKITGKFSLTQLQADTDLDNLLDIFYIQYLKFKLAQDICLYNNIAFAPEKLERLRQLERNLNGIAPQDLSGEKLSTMSGSGGYNWADVNIGRGWRP